ncbi:MAG: transposase [Christensenellales bacterium]
MKKSEPDDLGKAMNLGEMAALKARIAQLENHTLELEALVKYYEERLRLSRHKQFGASSEKSGQDANQLSFFNEAEVLADANVPEPELIEM